MINFFAGERTHSLSMGNRKEDLLPRLGFGRDWWPYGPGYNWEVLLDVLLADPFSHTKQVPAAKHDEWRCKHFLHCYLGSVVVGFFCSYTRSLLSAPLKLK